MSLSCSTVFSIPLQGRSIYPFFNFLSILLCGQPGQQCRQFCKFSFSIVYYKTWSSCRDYVICLFVKIPEVFVCVILQDSCSVVHIPLLLSLLLFLAIFSHLCQLMVFYWKLSDSKSTQISRTLFSILADLNNATVWMVSILPLITNSSSLFSKSLGTVPSVPAINVSIVTLNFHSFLSSLARS